MAEIKLYLPSEVDTAPVCTPGPDGRCSICADEGTPGRVLELHSGNMATVEMPDGAREVAMDLIDEVAVGDRVLVHLGFAIARLEDEA